MLFNSISFLLFFIVVTGLYFVLPAKFRWFMLLSASCYFYMCFIPIYILILAGTIVVDYLAGIWIEQAPAHRKKPYLIISLIANIGVLCVFKYGNFFLENIEVLVKTIGWNYSIRSLAIILPIGLSFHTFQAMSYTIEVYRGNQKAERHFGIYALYVMYYPQLVAGPIERPQHLLPQFHATHSFDPVRVGNGLKQMLWGFFKKLVIADGMAIFVNPVYNSPQSFEGITLLAATVFFAFQIFCDFSGYSDIALGASRIMGIELMQNFRSPYLSKSIAEFWSRWHISLSTWFKDYLYIPLGGNRVSKIRMFFNLMVVFVVSGFWHGANWTFLVWGALHGSYLILERITAESRSRLSKGSFFKRFPRLYKLISLFIVFLLVNLAWIFFRAKDVQTGWLILTKIIHGVPLYLYRSFSDSAYLWLEPLIFQKDLHQYFFQFLMLLIAVGFMMYVHVKEKGLNFLSWMNAQTRLSRWMILLFLSFYMLFFGAFHNSGEFIYFQF